MRNEDQSSVSLQRLGLRSTSNENQINLRLKMTAPREIKMQSAVSLRGLCVVRAEELKRRIHSDQDNTFSQPDIHTLAKHRNWRNRQDETVEPFITTFPAKMRWDISGSRLNPLYFPADCNYYYSNRRCGHVTEANRSILSM